MSAATGRRATALLAVVALLLTACANGSQVYDYVAANYSVLQRNGDASIEARSDAPVETVAGDLLDRFPGRDVLEDSAGTFYRYDDEFIAVRPDPAGGSLISVDDDEVGSTRWVPLIGGFYLPGGRFGGPRVRSGGGTGEVFRGGGPGAGK